MANKQIKVAVTGAAGQIGYGLLFRLASGEVFGKDVDVHLQLLELEASLPILQGVKMELDDCAFPNLASIIVTSDLETAFADADWCLLVGSVPRKAGMERNDLLNINGSIFVGQGKAIDKVAKEEVQVLVIGNPCNTNALIAQSVCQRVNKNNFYAMTMLDEKRAISQLALKADVHNTTISRLAIWGNHSSTQYPDFSNALINQKVATDVIGDQSWLENDFLQTVQQRGASIIKARGLSSSASAANAAIETIKKIITPTPANEFFSLALSSDGSYGIEKGLIFSYPVRSDGKNIQIVQDLELNDFAKEKITLTEEELKAEKEAVKELIS